VNNLANLLTKRSSVSQWQLVKAFRAAGAVLRNRFKKARKVSPEGRLKTLDEISARTEYALLPLADLQTRRPLPCGIIDETTPHAAAYRALAMHTARVDGRGP